MYQRLDRVDGYFQDSGYLPVGHVLKSVEDYRGLRIKISSPQIVSSSIKLLGATPVSIPFAEAYNALETGVVDSTLATVSLSSV